MPPLGLVLTAAWWVFGYMAGRTGRGIVSYDIYNQYYPNLVYALRSLREGHGLLWTSLQNCGQPFLPATVLAPFYPMNVAYLFLDPGRGIQVIAFLHLALGGIGTYGLCREIGLRRCSSFAAAISFEMGAHLLAFAGWLPVTVMSAYVWLPFVLAFCERALRAPSVRVGLGLGGVLALSVLGAHPQMTMFIYQLVLLRVIFELATGGARAVRRGAGVLALGLVLPLALGAAELLPAAEFAARSIRARALDTAAIFVGPPFDWSALRRALATRDVNFGRTFPITFAALAPLAFVARENRRQAAFHALVVVLFAALAVPGPILRLYLALPVGRIFRLPARFLWVASFGACMLIGLGADAVARSERRWRVQLPVLALLGAGALWLVAGSKPIRPELWAVGGLAGAAALAMRPANGRLRVVETLAPPLVVAAFALHLSRAMFFSYADWPSLLARDEPVFAFLREHMTTADRFHAVAPLARAGLAEKAASVFGVPEIADYEPQTSQRFAEIEVLMRTNHAFRTISDYVVRFTRGPRNRRLFDLLAGRYLVVAEKGERPAIERSLRAVGRFGDVLVYENPQAFSRAFYVPAATVIADPARRLQALAFDEQIDLHAVVLLERPPPDGVLGRPGPRGEARIDEDRSEEVRIDVRAEVPGFLVLTDQDYPGWEATVNGAPAPTLRANHAFRAVAVPAGESTVVWRYRARAVWVGVAVSLVTLAGFVAAIARSSR